MKLRPLPVLFDDGSVGWYEADGGPMMSQVRDEFSPRGSISMVMDGGGMSADINTHT